MWWTRMAVSRQAGYGQAVVGFDPKGMSQTIGLYLGVSLFVTPSRTGE